jgi:hypothetical protein
MGTLEGGRLDQDIERQVKDSLSAWAVRGDCGGGAPLLGTLRAMEKKALVTGISLHGGPVGGPWRGDFFTRDFERQLKEGSGNGASLCMGL